MRVITLTNHIGLKQQSDWKAISYIRRLEREVLASKSFLVFICCGKVARVSQANHRAKLTLNQSREEYFSKNLSTVILAIITRNVITAKEIIELQE